MSERGALRAKLDKLVREIAKFGLVGGVGLLVNMAVFNLVRHTTEVPVVRASILATVVAIACNYAGFRYFAYRDRDKSGRTRELTLFLLFSLAGLVIENGVLYAATYGFGWDTPLQSNVFKFSGIAVATLFRFWSYRTWVFRALPTDAGTDAQAGADSGAGADAGAGVGARAGDEAVQTAEAILQRAERKAQVGDPVPAAVPRRR
ncbi:GtrA family protein [Streptomyces sp. ODS05-4]|uniref:GtrA family protein n=1 Tax=Streptomyces sp. ODS05-4 TaxID=2944939 RepID=UPI00210F128B|nr:GtrA family protein [Streptomyces sp. ODS05-4]